MSEWKPKFEINSILRYGSGISALFRFEFLVSSKKRYYGTHVLGGTHAAYDNDVFTGSFYELKLANEKDIEFCKLEKPEWFNNFLDISG